jgi:bloom syndrome protein
VISCHTSSLYSPDYSYADIQKKVSQINKDTDITDVQKDRKRQAFYTVNQFCLNDVDCRRMLLLNHFSEKFDPNTCNGTCDNCASTAEVSEIDLTTSAILFVKMIQELESRHMKITGPISIHAFRGTSKQSMAQRNFVTLENFAKGAHVSADLVKRLLDNLVARQILATDLEEASVKNRAPVSYVYVNYTLCRICRATADGSSL